MREDAARVVDFSVASYNVLAQNLLEDNENLYRACGARALRWEYRSQNLLHEIGELRPDVSARAHARSFVIFFTSPHLSRLFLKAGKPNLHVLRS